MNGDGRMKNFLRLLDTGQLTSDPNGVRMPTIVIRTLEVMVIIGIVYGGTRVTINNLQVNVAKLEDIVGTSNSEKTLCERSTRLETQFENIEKFMDRIEKKIDRRR